MVLFLCTKEDYMEEKKSIIPGFVKKVAELMQIVFIVLRACDVVSWPWYVVLSPLFVYAAWLILCAAICGVAAVKNKL